MSIKVTLRALTIAQGALQALGQFKLPPKTSYFVSRVASKVTTELNAVEIQRRKAIKQYGTVKTGTTETYEVLPDNIVKFNEEMNALLDSEVELDTGRISLKELFARDVQIEAWILEGLRPLINTEELDQLLQE